MVPKIGFKFRAKICTLLWCVVCALLQSSRRTVKLLLLVNYTLLLHVCIRNVLVRVDAVPNRAQNPRENMLERRLNDFLDLELGVVGL